MYKVLVVGTGCIGSVYACILARSNRTQVTCVCRSDYEFVKEYGLKVSSSILGEIQSRPTVVQNVAEAIHRTPGAFDYIIICTKAAETTIARVIEQINPAITPGMTSIVVIQNGLGVERVFHTAYPEATIISGVAYMPTIKISPGVFLHSEMERLHLGLYPSAVASRTLMTFAELAREGGAYIMIHDDIQAERWRKVVANGAVNPICALSRCPDRKLVESSTLGFELVKEVMEEIAAVATSVGYGHIVTPATVEMQFTRTLSRPWPGVQPSMMTDALNKRPMEVQAIIGEIVAIAGEKNVRIPRLATLYVLLMGLEKAQQA
ncbi:hypothetical protein LTR84_003745 [Exophiala bonariae]|uniref:2-dehydropantoate 2-reductase n=1 Tax=Exophiala bonariae TaxID=1690606 RepID=A0AAV9N5Z5_9EURO|nr:hypothetical protein LTR84_003745 [Exophiala bonariae]